ncbi:Crp/Fnr family transcriptional regulator [Tenacibaculum sp. UWU-22]|uniref:Crp/Fnr family transcriptional regulator n=1 Tax=Tenacibaculum sp. UWU-22 TaxID=3234187 RepID=UPI0034DB292B
MNNFTLKTYLTSNLDIDESEILSIQKNCLIKEYAKDDFLLRNNERCQHIFFVEKGLLKQYMIDAKGKEHILLFAPENWFVTDIESVYFNQPSQYFIQALEPARVAFIDDDFIRKLEQKIPKFRDFNNLMLHNQIRTLQRRVIMLMSQTAEERYQQFIKTYPDILLRVPQTMVASYLGITPESLSRVRRELVNKNFKN